MFIVTAYLKIKALSTERTGRFFNEPHSATLFVKEVTIVAFEDDDLLDIIEFRHANCTLRLSILSQLQITVGHCF